MEKNTPEMKFRAGAITATVWKNATKKDGQDVHYFTISLDRNYTDKEGNWKSTNSMRVNDLPKAKVVLNKAYEALVLSETHKDQSKDQKKSSSDAIEEEDIVM